MNICISYTVLLQIYMVRVLATRLWNKNSVSNFFSKIINETMQRCQFLNSLTQSKFYGCFYNNI